MSRNMIGANERVFQLLARHCAQKGELIHDPAAARWIASNSDDKRWLKHVGVTEYVRFGLRKSISRLSFDGSDYFATIGFESEVDAPELIHVELNGGAFVALVFELLPMPTASAAQIRNIVEAGKDGELGYVGHEFSLIATLFPGVQLYRSAQPLPPEGTWSAFFLIALGECKWGESWMSPELSDALQALARLEMPSLGYRALCRSVFDWDPSTMFMALYRCVESTYAYESCRALGRELDLATDWIDLAAALERAIGWHPREEDSLIAILQYANENTLEELCSHLKVALEVNRTPESLRRTTAKAIYRLRNHIVHHRPGMDGDALHSVDWNSVCTTLATVVTSVHLEAFRGV